MDFPVEEVNFADVVVKQEYCVQETQESDYNDSEYWKCPDIKPIDPLKQEPDEEENFNQQPPNGSPAAHSFFLTPKVEENSHSQESEFPCCKCPEKFTSKKILLGHLKRIHNKCLYCQADFPTTLKLQLHMVYNHRGLPMDISAFPFICTVCKKIFEDPETLKVHNDEHTNAAKKSPKRETNKAKEQSETIMTRISKTSYQCEFCNRIFSDKIDIDMHIQRIHIKKTLDYPCPHCGEILCNKTSCLKYMLEYHRDLKDSTIKIAPRASSRHDLKYQIQGKLYSNTTERTKNVPRLKIGDFSCFTCFVAFDSKIRLLGHLLRAHNKCLYCSFKLANIHQLKSHMVFKHKGLPMDIAAFPFACTMCKDVFDDPELLKHHFQKHKLETPFACKFCTQTFQRRANLEVHIKKRHNKRFSYVDYACPYCGKVLQNKLACYNHMKLHEEKSFTCPVCSEAFKIEEALVAHMATCRVHFHTCTVCQWSSTDPTEFLKHMRCSKHLVPDEKKPSAGLQDPEIPVIKTEIKMEINEIKMEIKEEKDDM